MAKVKDISGKRYGRLVVLGLSESQGFHHKRWDCICDCGQSAPSVCVSALRNGRKRSCGCLLQERYASMSTEPAFVAQRISRPKHGHASVQKSPEYSVWVNMKARCNNQNSTYYHAYGARGIRVCSEWNESFEAFLRDMGPRPSRRYQIDRTDNSRGYEPGNCTWVLPAENSRNTRRNRVVSYQGEEICVTDLAKRVGLRPGTLLTRLDRGWALDRAIQPARHRS